jgi:hypothetical protein
MLAFLLFQVALEAVILLFLLAAVRARFTPGAVWILAVLFAVNVPLGKRVLEVGYDVYSYYGSVLAFLAGLALLEGGRTVRMLAFGAGSAVTLFAREINLLLLPVMSGAAALAGIVRRRAGLLVRAGLLLVPFVLVLAGTMAYRMELTGNPRPTRTVFWHSFWAGVGQFSNPMGLRAPTDTEVRRFAGRIDPTIRASEVKGASPDSPYESLLREQALLLARNHPWLLVRNTLYRIGLILSPGFYEHGEFTPKRFTGFVRVLSLIFTALVAWGCVRVGRVSPAFLALVLLTILAMILSFSWFYFVGRVPLVSSHVYFLPISVLLADALGGRLWRREPAAP